MTLRERLAPYRTEVRRIGWLWLVNGACGALFAAGFVVAHYAFGVPIHDNDTGREITDAKLALFTAALCVGGGAFAVGGRVLLRLTGRPKDAS